jgi:hypothetical protein
LFKVVADGGDVKRRAAGAGLFQIAANDGEHLEARIAQRAHVAEQAKAGADDGRACGRAGVGGSHAFPLRKHGASCAGPVPSDLANGLSLLSRAANLDPDEGGAVDGIQRADRANPAAADAPAGGKGISSPTPVNLRTDRSGSREPD